MLLYPPLLLVAFLLACLNSTSGSAVSHITSEDAPRKGGGRAGTRPDLRTPLLASTQRLFDATTSANPIFFLSDISEDCDRHRRAQVVLKNIRRAMFSWEDLREEVEWPHLHPDANEFLNTLADLYGWKDASNMCCATMGHSNQKDSLHIGLGALCRTLMATHQRKWRYESFSLALDYLEGVQCGSIKGSLLPSLRGIRSSSPAGNPQGPVPTPPPAYAGSRFAHLILTQSPNHLPDLLQTDRGKDGVLDQGAWNTFKSLGLPPLADIHPALHANADVRQLRSSLRRAHALMADPSLSKLIPHVMLEAAENAKPKDKLVKRFEEVHEVLEDRMARPKSPYTMPFSRPMCAMRLALDPYKTARDDPSRTLRNQLLGFWAAIDPKSMQAFEKNARTICNRHAGPLLESYYSLIAELVAIHALYAKARATMERGMWEDQVKFISNQMGHTRLDQIWPKDNPQLPRTPRAIFHLIALTSLARSMRISLKDSDAIAKITRASLLAHSAWKRGESFWMGLIRPGSTDYQKRLANVAEAFTPWAPTLTYSIRRIIRSTHSDLSVLDVKTIENLSRALDDFLLHLSLDPRWKSGMFRFLGRFV